MKNQKQTNLLHIKFWRNNIFLNLTTLGGKLLFKCSCGYIKTDQKGNLTAAFIYLLKLMKNTVNLKGNYWINLNLEGALNSSQVNLVYTQLAKWQFKIRFVRLFDRIAHNGCRPKVKRVKLRKYRYYS